jgi:hypothetical protein
MRAHLNIGRSTKYMYVFAIVRVSGVYGINSDEFLVVVTDCLSSSNKIEISSFSLENRSVVEWTVLVKIVFQTGKRFLLELFIRCLLFYFQMSTSTNNNTASTSSENGRTDDVVLRWNLYSRAGSNGDGSLCLYDCERTGEAIWVPYGEYLVTNRPRGTRPSATLTSAEATAPLIVPTITLYNTKNQTDGDGTATFKLSDEEDLAWKTTCGP